MHENDDLDLLLDSALKTYAESEISPRLEQRILARIAAEPSVAPRPRWLPWAIALPLAACILLFVFIMSRQHSEPSQIAHATYAPSSRPDVAKAAPNPAPIRSARTRASFNSSRPSLRAGGSAPLPKLDVFPTPEPLTPEEQALVAYAARAPKPQLQALIAAQQQPEAPLNIAAIQISPLEHPNDGNK